MTEARKRDVVVLRNGDRVEGVLNKLDADKLEIEVDKKAVPIKAKTIEVKIQGVKSPITLTGVPNKEAKGTFTEFQGKHDRFTKKMDFGKVEIVAKVLEDKPAFTFKPED